MEIKDAFWEIEERLLLRSTYLRFVKFCALEFCSWVIFPDEHSREIDISTVTRSVRFWCKATGLKVVRFGC